MPKDVQLVGHGIDDHTGRPTMVLGYARRTMGTRDSDQALRELRAIALEAARTGGSVVAHAARPERVDEKSAGDYVTEVDRASESAIRSLLAERTPDVPMLGEEGGGRIDVDVYWVVDPLDGTRNYLLGFPAVGVSVAAVRRGQRWDEPIAGAVVAPFLGLEFDTARGQGAASRGHPLRVSDRPSGEAVVTTGFPFRRRELIPRHLAALGRVIDHVQDLRRPGAAALDLAWVAAGVFDGFFELGLSPWDMAAGSLLVREAGGVVSDWSGGEGFLEGDILAGSPPVYPVLLDAARSSDDRHAG
jgi:myo-inositol-1(or 4)-monophosphatase